MEPGREAVAQRWLVEPDPPPQPALVRLICLPYAGSGAVAYRPWRRWLPPWVGLQIVQLPGRENRLREPPLRRMGPLVQLLSELLGPQMGQPYALFGHSMGALIAFELARALRRDGAPPPRYLFVSGRRAPQLADPEPPLHQLADGPFVGAMVRRYNGIPQVILQDIELLRVFLPTLRADLELIETCDYVEEAPLACPIMAFGGQTDRRARAEDLAAWQAQTALTCDVQQLPGDHFYLQREVAALLELIVGRLEGEGGAHESAR